MLCVHVSRDADPATAMDFTPVLAWFDAAERDLPWRDPDAGPWAILVSEVMLQQTPVVRVEPVWRAWMQRWPTPADLAAATGADAVRAWGKLGYPRRAMRLHACAQALVERFDGAVPSDVDELLSLPGVGDYTARAVACFAFGQDVPVVDITEAAASTAMFLGHKYSVVTTLDRAVPLIEDRLKLAGLEARCASVRASGMAVLELEEYPERAVEAIVSQAEQAVQNDKAEVIVLGCGGMAGLDEQIRQRTGVPVVDGVASAVTIAESLVRLGLSTSKVRTYATPRPKTVIGWPITASQPAANQNAEAAR